MKKLISLALLLAVTLLCVTPAMAAGFTARVSLGLNNGGTLQPGQEYRVPILAQYEDEPPTQLREEDLGGRHFAVSLREGTDALYLPTVETDRGLCWLVVRTRPSYTTGTSTAQVLLRLMEEDNPREVSRTEAKLTVASPKMSDQTVAAMKAGDDLAVENTAPVITGQQFRQIGELNSYGAVTLTGKGWEYTVGVGDLEAQNLYSTTATRPEYAAAYPERKFAFLSFPGAPDFGVAGTMTIDVSETPEEFDGEYHLYRLLDGQLYHLRTEYDSEAATLTFYPSQLGDYVITDRLLEDLSQTETLTAVETAAPVEAVKAEPTAATPRTGNSASSASGSSDSAASNSSAASGSSGSASTGGTSGNSTSGSGSGSSSISGSSASASSNSASAQSGSAPAADQNPSTGSQRTGTAAVLGLSALAIAAVITARKS